MHACNHCLTRIYNDEVNSFAMLTQYKESDMLNSRVLYSLCILKLFESLFSFAAD